MLPLAGAPRAPPRPAPPARLPRLQLHRGSNQLLLLLRPAHQLLLHPFQVPPQGGHLAAVHARRRQPAPGNLQLGSSFLEHPLQLLDLPAEWGHSKRWLQDNRSSSSKGARDAALQQRKETASAAEPTCSSLSAACCAWRRRASTRGCSAPASSTGLLKQSRGRQAAGALGTADVSQGWLVCAVAAECGLAPRLHCTRRPLCNPRPPPGTHPLSTGRSPQPSRASRSAPSSVAPPPLGVQGTAAALSALFSAPARRCRWRLRQDSERSEQLGEDECACCIRRNHLQALLLCKPAPLTPSSPCCACCPEQFKRLPSPPPALLSTSSSRPTGSSSAGSGACSEPMMLLPRLLALPPAVCVAAVSLQRRSSCRSCGRGGPLGRMNPMEAAEQACSPAGKQSQPPPPWEACPDPHLLCLMLCVAPLPVSSPAAQQVVGSHESAPRCAAGCTRLPAPELLRGGVQQVLGCPVAVREVAPQGLEAAHQGSQHL